MSTGRANPKIRSGPDKWHTLDTLGVSRMQCVRGGLELLFAGIRFKTMIEIGRAVPRHHLFNIGLVRAFALPELLGAALLGGFAIFRGNGRRINQLLSNGGGRQRK